MRAEWNGRIGSDSQCAAPTILANRLKGEVRLTTGDDAAATMAVSGVQLEAQTNWRPTQGGLVCEWSLKVDTATSVCIFAGLTDQAAALEMPFTLGAGDALTSGATDAVGFLFDTAADTDNIWLVGVAGDVDATKQNSGLAFSSGVFRTLRVEVSSAGVATFYIDGVLIGSAMTGATTAAVSLTPVVAAFSRTTTSRFIDVDFFYAASAR